MKFGAKYFFTKKEDTVGTEGILLEASSVSLGGGVDIEAIGKKFDFWRTHF